MSLKLLIIGYVWPEPRSSAAGSRMMELIDFFQQQGYEVTFASPAALSEHRADLKAIEVHEVAIELNSESFDGWVRHLDPQVVMFDRFMMEEQFGWRVEQQCPQALRILDTEDLHSLRQVRHQRFKKLDPAETLDKQFDDKQTLFLEMSELDIAQREIAAIMRSDLSIMISRFEIELLTECFGVRPENLVHLPFMLERENITLPRFKAREHFVTIGNFRHAPNWDSVLWLKQVIWPRVREQLPKAELHVYGAYPPKKATDLHRPADGFYVDGWAPDVHRVLSQARVCLAPLRFGAGIKGKFTDAMLNGTPSVTTPVGAESMHGDIPWCGEVAESVPAIVAGAVRLYKEAEFWQDCQQNGFDILETEFSRQKIQAGFLEQIDSNRANLTVARKENFMGQLLRHHHHKSTKYMSQWIEAKNKLLP